MAKHHRTTLLLCLAVLTMAMCATLEEAPTVAQLAPLELPEGLTAVMVDEGRRIFLDGGNCFACHGEVAEGTEFAPNLRDKTWMGIDGSYDSIVRVVSDGIPLTEFPAPMPPMGGADLTEQQIRDVSAYVYAISHPPTDPGD